ncbi:hypothetical protein Q2T76_04980 [Lactobacillus sp. YT155]|uniref:DUF6792 domain-containing protein n=1 Tax=Lactobacillus sp. YT155 TaxID=3060955 RepID=UPI00265E556C|nr:DUF6792 domain-containing protein [Lactobacillus sp. YT155]MDO1605412.1 hypothetical protein [Lactobacillus sp. YT155]
MDNYELLSASLAKLEHILSDMAHLNFKAHTYISLAIDDSQTRQLYTKNKRLKMRLNYLKIAKKKQLNLIIENLTEDKYLFDKIQLIRKNDVISTTNTSKSLASNKITLKQMLLDIQQEKTQESLLLVRQCLAYLLKKDLLTTYPNTSSEDLFASKDFKMDLMELNYLFVFFTTAELQDYVSFLIYKYTDEVVKEIKFYDARDILLDSQNVGFSAVAYYFKFKEQPQCFISYKGTEGELEDPRVKSLAKRFNNYISESYKDWAYNIDAMLFGDTDNDDQLTLAREFAQFVIKNVKTMDQDTTIYALGHSLGGHFVQTIQLLDHAFDYGYTLNSAPIQLKQIKKNKPELFTEDTWNKLFSLTYYNTQEITTDLLIRNSLNEDFNEIQNEWFRNDLTRIYYAFPYTFYIGTSKYLNTNNWYYPFKSNITTYLTEEDIQTYMSFFGGLIKHLKKANPNSARQIIQSITTYSFKTFKDLYKYVNSDKAKKIFNDFATYLYDAKIFIDKPAVVKDNLKRELSKPKFALQIIQYEWPFVKSLNNEMVETVIYFHTIEGARYFK